jgi:hypothetical protein
MIADESSQAELPAGTNETRPLRGYSTQPQPVQVPTAQAGSALKRSLEDTLGVLAANRGASHDSRELDLALASLLSEGPFALGAQ